MRHQCEATDHPIRPILSSYFLVAASLIAWPDLDPLEIAGDEADEETQEEPESEVTHLLVDGEFDNFENSCPLGLLTKPLPLLHTVQLQSVELKSIHNIEYNLDDLKCLSIWNSHVSPQGLFLLLRSTTSLTHLALGGKDTQVINDSNDPLTQPVVPPPSFPPTLQFLHLNTCALVNWQGSMDNPLRPRILSWLGHLHGSLSLTAFECKAFTNDVCLPTKIISLAEGTLQKLSLFFVGTYPCEQLLKRLRYLN